MDVAAWSPGHGSPPISMTPSPPTCSHSRSACTTASYRFARGGVLTIALIWVALPHRRNTQLPDRTFDSGSPTAPAQR